MNKKTIFKALILAVLLVLTFSTFTFADLEQDNAATGVTSPVLTDMNANSDDLMAAAINDGDVINNDIFECDSSSQITKDVNGNVYIMAQDVKIKSKVINGNVFLLAQDISIDGTQITGSVYLCGDTIKFNGTCSEIYAIGSKINIESDSKIARDARVCGEKISFKGKTLRDFYAAGEKINIAEGSVIEGNFDYTSNEEIKIEGTVKGKVNFTKAETNVNIKPVKTTAIIVWEIISSVISAIIISIVIAALFLKAIKKPEFKPGENLLLGLAFLVAVPIVCIALMLTVVGLVPAFILLAAYILLLFVAKLIALLIIADAIYKKIDENGTSTAKVVLIDIALIAAYEVVKLIPIVGGIVGFGLVLLGCGTVVKCFINKGKEE